MIRTDKGFIYIWALFSVAILGIILAGAGQVWQTKVQREKERELLFVGEQFQKAIMSYYNATQKYPESLQDLLVDKRSSTPKRHLRKIYPDPITNSYEWGLVKEPVSEQETGLGLLSRKDTGIIGVYSLSTKIPVKSKNFPEDFSGFSKADSYQDWKFVFYIEDTSGESAKQDTSGQPASNSQPN